jgi:HPt (histidine-containing phosphotransfer) domain-containing protein
MNHEDLLEKSIVEDLLRIEDHKKGFFAELIQIYEQQTIEGLKKIHSLVESKDYAIQAIAHKLKGSSFSMGLTRLAKLFQELESTNKSTKPENFVDLLDSAKITLDQSLNKLKTLIPQSTSRHNTLRNSIDLDIGT